jgi:CRP/FNR family transcriptional regulator
MQELPVHYSPNCSSCGLKDLCFANGLKDTDIVLLDKLVDRKPSIYKGEHLYKTGENLRSFFAVKAGMIKVYSFDENKNEVIHGFYLPGDVLGLDALAYENHPFSAIALDVTNVCEIPFNQLTQLTKRIPDLNSQLLHLMSQEIVNSRRHSSLLTQKTAEEKVAFFILSMSMKFQSRGYIHTQFRLNILHKDVANYLNLTPETVSRILTKFNKDKIVIWAKKEVNIFDEKALKNMAGEDNLY